MRPLLALRIAQSFADGDRPGCRLQRRFEHGGGRRSRSAHVFFWGSSFNDGTTQTALDPLGRGPVRTH